MSNDNVNGSGFNGGGTYCRLVYLGSTTQHHHCLHRSEKFKEEIAPDFFTGALILKKWSCKKLPKNKIKKIADIQNKNRDYSFNLSHYFYRTIFIALFVSHYFYGTLHFQSWITTPFAQKRSTKPEK